MMDAAYMPSTQIGVGIKVKSSDLNTEEELVRAEDLRCVERVLQGQSEAFRELVERYQGRAFSVAMSVVGKREDAEEIVQEAFLKVYRNLHSFRGQSSFYTWFYRIIFNLAIDLCRRRYRQVESQVGETSTMDAIAQHAGTHAGDFLSSVADPDSALERSNLRLKLKAAIESLAPHHRAVIVLREIEGLSYKEIGDVVGCSQGTVMSRLHHARRKLQQILNEYSPTSGSRAPLDREASNVPDSADSDSTDSDSTGDSAGLNAGEDRIGVAR